MKRLLAILSLALLFSCAEEKAEPVPVPDEVVPAEVMIDVLVDLHIMEASVNLSILHDNKLTRDSAEFHNPYKAHNITKAQFEESFRYYSRDPEVLNEMYEEVISVLNRMHAEGLKTLPKDTTTRNEQPRPSGMPRPKLRK